MTNPNPTPNRAERRRQAQAGRLRGDGRPRHSEDYPELDADQPQTYVLNLPRIAEVSGVPLVDLLDQQARS